MLIKCPCGRKFNVPTLRQLLNWNGMEQGISCRMICRESSLLPLKTKRSKKKSQAKFRESL